MAFSVPILASESPRGSAAMSEPSSPSGPVLGRAVARVLDGRVDRLPPAGTLVLLPVVGLGLLLVAGLGWVGMVVALTSCAAAVVALVRAASWSDLTRAASEPESPTGEERSSG